MRHPERSEGPLGVILSEAKDPFRKRVILSEAKDPFHGGEPLLLGAQGSFALRSQDDADSRSGA